MLVSCLSTVGFVVQIPAGSAQSSNENEWKTAYVFDRGHVLNATMMYKLTSGEFANYFRDIHGHKFVEGGLAEIGQCDVECIPPSPIVGLSIEIDNATSPGTLILKIPKSKPDNHN